MTRISGDALKLLKEKEYFKENESDWSDIADRVSKAIASPEQDAEKAKVIEEQLYHALNNMDFIFSTPVLLNADINNPGQLSSCFIVSTKDNIDDICKTDAEFAKIFQKNGGAGTDLSVLRPAKSPVGSSKGYAGGVITFMEKYDATADQMTRHNPSRKGALKINLVATHPQIYDFIHAKDDTAKLNRMNISLSLSDKFLNAVANDEMWYLKFPDIELMKKNYNKEWDGNIELWEEKGYPIKTYQEVKARDLFSEMAKAAWKTGEPGVNFTDRQNKDNPNKHIDKNVYTNPCLHKDTYLITKNGLEKISKVASYIWNGVEYRYANFWVSGIKPIYIVKTKSGFEYKVTENHKFMLDDESWCEAKNLVGKNIKFEVSKKEWVGILAYSNINYSILGFIFGDGTFHKASHRMKYVYANPEKDKEVISIIENEWDIRFTPSNTNNLKSSFIGIIPNSTIYSSAFEHTLPNRMIPDWIMQLPPKEMSEFLKGLFSANGSNNNKVNKIQLVSTNKSMLIQVQQMLLLFGLKSKIWVHNKKNTVRFANGDYVCKESYHLIISRTSYKKFLDTISFIQSYKQVFSPKKYTLGEKMYEKVISVEYLEDGEVWDFSEESAHCAVTNGAFVHNCSEFSNIPYSSCNLGSINLLNFIKNNNEFDYDRLKDISYKAIRWFDNMIEINVLPLDAITKVTKGIRPIGLGIMGLADALYKMGIKYNSQEGYSTAEKIILTMKESVMQSSCDLAIERGNYPFWKGSEYEKNGINIRNSSMLSLAPTGTISFLANVSGGAEPAYALCYNRRTYDGTNYYIVNQVFRDELDKLGIYSEEVLEKISKNNGSCRGIKEIPRELQDIFVTASDIPPKDHVDMIAILQKHVDLSISKTVNFSKNASVKDIEDVFIYAWKQGLKGLTVYRDGCREDQTLSTLATYKEKDKETSEPLYDYIIPKSKEELGETYGSNMKYKVACGSLYINLCRDSYGNLVETFITTGKGGVCQSNINAISRLISTLLRSGVSIEYVTKQLLGIQCNACSILRSQGKEVSKSCPHAIAEYLREKHDQGNVVIKETKNKRKLDLPRLEMHKDIEIKNIIIKDNKMICPNCGEKLRMESGCISCNCGFSKCG